MTIDSTSNRLTYPNTSSFVSISHGDADVKKDYDVFQSITGNGGHNMRLFVIGLTTAVFLSVSMASTAASGLLQPKCQGSACGDVSFTLSPSSKDTHAIVKITNKGDRKVKVEFSAAYSPMIAKCRSKIAVVQLDPGEEKKQDVLGGVICTASGAVNSYRANYAD